MIDYTIRATANNSVFKQVVPSSEIQRVYEIGENDLSDAVVSNLSPQLANIALRVNSYCLAFDQTVQEMARANGFKRQAMKSLSMSSSNKKKVYWGNAAIKNIDSVHKFMNLMYQGHALLSDIREELTGQHITTKFIISFEEHLYVVDEKDIAPNLILTSFGAGTEANPVSLAYEINRDLLEAIKEYKTMDLEDMSTQMAIEVTKQAKWEWLTEKKFPTMPHAMIKQWWDNKDSEVYEWVIQSKKDYVSSSEYDTQRKSAGGGPGKINTPFFKMGDVGTTQVKYFNLDKDSKQSAAFIRFNILNKKLKKLNQIFINNCNNPEKLKNALKNFFTFNDTSKNVPKAIQDEVNKEANRLAREGIDKFFSNN